LQTFQIYQAGDLKPIHVPKRCVSRLFIPNKADMTRYLVTAQTHGRIGGKSVPEPKLPPIKSLLCAGHCGVTSPVTASELVKPTVPTKELGAMSNASDFFALYKASKGTENRVLHSLSFRIPKNGHIYCLTYPVYMIFPGTRMILSIEAPQ
jgi:hypothetical protein